EDGIRDLTVTGVQTCALPIFQLLLIVDVDLQRNRLVELEQRAAVERREGLPRELELHREHRAGLLAVSLLACLSIARDLSELREIGRASCRERGMWWVGVVGW